MRFVFLAFVSTALLSPVACRHRTPPARDVATPVSALRDAHVPTAARQTLENTEERRVLQRTTADSGAGTPRENPERESRLFALADQVAGRMTEIRGLSQRRPIARGVMSRDQIVARLRARTEAEYPPGELDLEGELYRRLGMIPESLDYERTLFELLEEQVMGFYDPTEQRLYIADWVPLEVQAGTMAHEITHALQDQHFDIGRFVHHVRGRGDAQTAAMSVVEGDATAAMLDYTLVPMGRSVRDLPDPTALVRDQSGGPGQERLAAAPRALRETLLFPYISGLAMVTRALRDHSDYRGVDALLARPPESTEQVLHPEKLARREPPVALPVVVPRPLEESFTVVYQDVLGELGARLFFNTVLDDDRADASAAGWAGDRAVLLAPRGTITPLPDAGVSLTPNTLSRIALLWTVLLDPATNSPADHRVSTDAEAVEFAASASAVLSHRYASHPSISVPGALSARALGEGRVSLVARRNRLVLIADRIPLSSAPAVIRSTLSTH